MFYLFVFLKKYTKNEQKKYNFIKNQFANRSTYTIQFTANNNWRNYYFYVLSKQKKNGLLILPYKF